MSFSSVGNIISGISVAGTDLEFIDEIIKTLNTFGLEATNIQPPVTTGMIMSIGDPNLQADVKIFIGAKPIQ